LSFERVYMSKKIESMDAAIAVSASEESAEDGRNDDEKWSRYAAEHGAASSAASYEAGLDGTCIVYYPPGHPALDK
jgi:hypothetical protein